ncbi:MAG: hypothetical protein RIR00_207 [Pseudomonadota bacterium]|jgi:hypothetical protein
MKWIKSLPLRSARRAAAEVGPLGIHSPVLDLCLTQGQELALDAGAGLAVRCESGCLWITEAQGGEDWVLLPGQQLRLAGRPGTCIQACRPSRLQLGRPECLPPLMALPVGVAV